MTYVFPKRFIRLTPGPNVIKLLMSVIYEFLYQSRVFVRDMSFQPILIVPGKARSLPKSAAPER